MLHTMFGPGNRWTTILGMVLAALYYLKDQGAAWPADRNGWLNLVVSTLIAAVFSLTKSSMVGSKPGDAPALTVGAAKTESGEPILPTVAASPEAKKAADATGGHVIP